MPKSYTGNQLLSLVLPEPQKWLPPLINAGSLGMIYARPGIGKSYFCLWLAAALAGGRDFLKWQSFSPASVLYVDGEMGIRELQDRYKELNRCYGSEMAKVSTSFLCPESFPDLMMPTINSVVGQKFYTDALHGKNVLILDNYCALTRPMKNESDVQIWGTVQPWLTGLRARNKCVVLVHHAGKSGDQLGTSTKEFALDWCLNFYQPADYDDIQGARFNIRFSKGRFRGEDKEGFTAWYQSVAGETRWIWQGAKESRLAQIKEMRAVGMNERDMALTLGLNLFSIKKLLKQIDDKHEEPLPDWLTEQDDQDRYW